MTPVWVVLAVLAGDALVIVVAAWFSGRRR
jgi:hypothetical protein